MDDPSFYGFPEFGVAGSFKAPRTVAGRSVDPDRRTFDADPVMESRVRRVRRPVWSATAGQRDDRRRACTR